MRLRILVSLSLLSCFGLAQSWELQKNQLLSLYNDELNSAYTCPDTDAQEFRICSDSLRNKQTGPFLLLHKEKASKVVVLFHGLSDSPFYFRSIAKNLYDNGSNVVVALLPGHALVDAKNTVRDKRLAMRWKNHVEQVITLSSGLGDTLYLGGFSTGAALALNYGLRYPETDVTGYLMFSGAFALNESVEKLAKIPGIKWVTRWLDRDYVSTGENPYKYPDVSKHAATVLMDIIKENRTLIRQSGLHASMFFAHSKSDTTTPIDGVEALVKQNLGRSQTYFISEKYEVCHGDIVLNEKQVSEIGIEENHLLAACSVPIANPVHKEMMMKTLDFLKNKN